MKVGKKVEAVDSSAGIVVWATNMIPLKTGDLPGWTKEEREKLAKAMSGVYEEVRESRAAIVGELE